MYLVYRCDCGRAVYSKEKVATKKCVCGKNLKVKERRIIAKVEDIGTSFRYGQKIAGREIW